MNSNATAAIVAALVAMVLLSGAILAAGSVAGIPNVAGEERVWFYVFGGFAAGLAAMTFSNYATQRTPATGWASVVLLCALLMAVAAVWKDGLPFRKAVLLLLLGSVAVAASAAALKRFQQGESIEIESHWGGLGGGLGGWRISTVTSLVLLVMVLTGALVAVLHDNGGQPSPGTVDQSQKNPGSKPPTK